MIQEESLRPSCINPCLSKNRYGFFNTQELTESDKAFNLNSLKWSF